MNTQDEIRIMRRKDGAFVIVYATPRGVLGVLATAGSRVTALASALTFALALGLNVGGVQ